MVQRFGSVLNLNVRVHALVLDGVFAADAPGRFQFLDGAPPSDDDVTTVVDIVRQRDPRLHVSL